MSFKRFKTIKALRIEVVTKLVASGKNPGFNWQVASMCFIDKDPALSEYFKQAANHYRALEARKYFRVV